MSLRIIFLVVSLCLHGYFSNALAETWYEYKSKNFIVYSDDDREKVEALVLDLEYFRYFLQIFTNVKNTEAIQPLPIYAYKNARNFAEDTNYGYTILGYFQPNIHGTVAFANLQKPEPGFTLGGREVLFHEYVHYFMNQFSMFRYPRWYDEGFADYLATFTREGKRVSIGKAIMDRVYTLRKTPWLSLELLLSSNDTIETPDHMDDAFYTFYAESWLFVHFLHTRPERKQDLLEYLQAINEGTPYKEAVVTAFETDLQSLYKELVDYWEEKQIPYKIYDFEEVDFSPKILVRRLADWEMALIHLKAKTFGLPRRIKTAEIRRDTRKFLKDYPENIEARLLMAESILMHGKEKEKEEARTMLEEVLVDHPNNQKASAIKAMDLIQTARQNGQEIPETILNEARSYLTKSLEGNPDDAFSIFYLGLVELYHPKPHLQEAVNALENGLALHPQNIPMEFQFAFILARANLMAEAKAQFFRLSKISYSQVMRDFAAACARQIEDPGEEFSCTYQDFENLGKKD